MLPNGQGVCLHAVRTRKPVVVPDVHASSGHIACDPRSQSEIVLPLIKDGLVRGVLDIDAHKPAQFDEDDIAPLERPYLGESEA